MKVLVTGGAGFVGSHTVDALLEKGYDVVVVDNLRTGKEQNVPRQAIFYQADICNEERLKEIFQKEHPEAVIHLAAQTNARVSLTEPELDSRLNVSCTKTLLKICEEFKVKRFVFASSAAVYGDSKDFPITEESEKNPISPYGEHKLEAEGLVEESDMSSCSLRYANIYGPRQDPTGEGGVVSIFYDRMKREEPVTVHGDGSQTRDFIFVKDVAKVNVTAVESDVEGVFNISTDTEVSIKQLAETLKKVLGSSSEISFVEKKNGDIYKSRLDHSKAKEAGLIPKITQFKEGLEEMR